MSREIVINATKHESRIAVLDEGQVVELWIERTRHRTIVGNIYKGRVTKVLPGMQSAFVDLGLERDAFLYVSDVIEDLEDYDSEHSDELHLDEVPAQQPRGETSISDLLREGQEIVVQVSKDTIAGKGARITSHITLPGRFLVYMPTVNHIGVSRRIETEEERMRLKHVLETIRPASAMKCGISGPSSKKTGRGGRPRPVEQSVSGPSPRHPWHVGGTCQRTARSPSVLTHSINQSLKLRITVGISRSLPKSLDAIGPNPPEPSERVKPFRKNGGS